MKRSEKTGEEVVREMFIEVTRPRGNRAVRIGMIVASWAFLVLGFVLTHNA